MQVVWRNYIQAMRQAGFGAGVGVYVASGLLTYGASKGTPLLAPMHVPTSGFLTVTTMPAHDTSATAKGCSACMHVFAFDAFIRAFIHERACNIAFDISLLAACLWDQSKQRSLGVYVRAYTQDTLLGTAHG